MNRVKRTRARPMTFGLMSAAPGAADIEGLRAAPERQMGTVKLALLERAGTVGLWSLLELSGDRYCIPSEESATS